jgi:putative polyhydroxyalkanoate system protein
MLEPIVITMSHRLGRDGARRRIEEGLAHIREQLAPFVSAMNIEWNGDRLDFTVTAMRQTINARIDVEEDIVRVERGLPLLLRVLSKTIISRIRSEGAHLLGKPAGV